MRIKFSVLVVIALIGLPVFGPALPAHAETITYTTVGTFLGGDTLGTNVYTDVANNIVITFDGVVSNSVDATPTDTAQASLGEFNTTGTIAPSLVAVASRFQLDIFQTAPDIGSATFVGTLSGSLSFMNSRAFLQFDAPLSASIIGAFVTTYTIIETDQGVPGRANLVSPSVNGGRSSVEANISIALVPEPSSLILSSLMLPVSGLIVLRRAKRKCVA
jgi:hypothetical protein